MTNSETKIRVETNSLARELADSIESFWKEMKGKNALFVGAREGKITPAQALLLIDNLSYLIHFTPPFLKRARSRASELGHKELAKFFEHKLSEEDGHELWAEKDQKELLAKYKLKGSEDPLLPMKTLVSNIATWIELNPFLYLSYILFAEYFTVLAAPELFKDLQSKCGLSDSFFTVIGNHAELDKEHVTEMLGTIDSLCDSSHAPALKEILSISTHLYDVFTDTVGKTNDKTP